MANSEEVHVEAAAPKAEASSSRWLANLILWVALIVQLARICQVESTKGDNPFLSANDRSRWCTVAALAINGSYEIDHLIFKDEAQKKRTPWYTIDLVRHRASDGELHYYSSKPALLPTMYAGVYWCLRAVTGLTLLNEPFAVARIMLVVVNLVPLGLFLWFMLRWFRENAKDDDDPIWSTILWACFVAWGTFLSTFVVTLNNHLPAAIAVGISVWCLDKILIRGDSRIRWFLLCGLCTSFGAANELPALGWVVAAGCALLVAFPKQTIIGYLTSLAPVAVAFFGLNYLAHDTWKPPYGHRNAGPEMVELEIEEGLFAEIESVSDRQLKIFEAMQTDVVRGIEASGMPWSNRGELRPARRENTYELLDIANQQQFAIRFTEDFSAMSINEWDDWYDFPGAYWAGNQQGVDKGEPSRGRYIAHCLVGHHGIFSLTPFWFVSLAGIFFVWHSRESFNFFKDRRLLLMLVILGTSVIVVGFYFARGLEDRNYGGVTSGFRWSFWLIPLWLWLSMDLLQSIKKPAIRRMVELLVVLSVFSASYPWRNPWTSPWAMQLCEYMGWI